MDYSRQNKEQQRFLSPDRIQFKSYEFISPTTEEITLNLGRIGLYLFTRDLRLDDNLPLLRLAEYVDIIIPIFIYTFVQIDNNYISSNNSIQFMTESLNSLQIDLRKRGSDLIIFHGDTLDILKKLYQNFNVDAISYSVDYTPFSKNRDNEINSLSLQYNVKVLAIENHTLFPMGKIIPSTGSTHYKVFTPYYKRIISIINNEITKCKASEEGLASSGTYQPRPLFLKPIIFADNDKLINCVSDDLYEEIKTTCERVQAVLITLDYAKNFYKENINNAVRGGRENGLNILNNIKQFSNYEKTKNFPSKNTTMLSAYLKFGVISIRELFWTIANNLGLESELLRQVIWHDFYAQLTNVMNQESLGYHSITLNKEIQSSIDNNSKQIQLPCIHGNYKRMIIPWDSIETEPGKSKWDAWKNGMTGFPIVDASTRQLNSIGWVHNRGRMISSNILTLILNISYIHGSRYYADKLIDYDPSNNQQNWMWNAQVSIDNPRSYPRIFNPFKQTKDYDKDCEYIKKWIPELKDVPNKEIHKWETEYRKHTNIGYPGPIVDFNKERERAIQIYNNASTY